MRYVLAASVALLIVVSGNAVRGQQSPSSGVPAQTRESYQRDIDDAVDRLGGALRIRRDGTEDFPAAREQLRILDLLLLRAPEFDLQGVTVPDRIEPRIADARNRLEIVEQIQALCIRHSQENRAAERVQLTLQINSMLRDRLQVGPIVDTEDRAEIVRIEQMMRRRAEDERQRLGTLDQLHADFLRIVARMSKLNVPADGEYEGTFTMDPAQSKIVVAIADRKIEQQPTEAQKIGFIFLTVRGTEVSGEAVYGEGESRAVIRLKGRYDLATSSFEATDDGGRVPAGYPAALMKSIDLKVKGKAALVRPQSGGEPLVAFDGTWVLRLNDPVEFTYQEDANSPVERMTLVELVCAGSWQASR